MESLLALVAIAVVVSAIILTITRLRSARSRPLPPQTAVPPRTTTPVPKKVPANPPERARDADPVRRFDREAVEALQGRECIYQEKVFVCNVKILRAVASQSGVMLKLEVLPSPGFARQEGTFSVTASWETFSVSKNHVYAAYVGWLVVTHPDLVEEIKAQARKAPDEIPLGVWINRRLFRPKEDCTAEPATS